MWGLERPLVSDGLSHLSLGTPDRVRLWQEAPLVPAKREPSVPAGRGVECRACGTLACRQTRFSCLVLALPCSLHLELSPGCVPAPRNTQGGGGVLVGGARSRFLLPACSTFPLSLKSPSSNSLPHHANLALLPGLQAPPKVASPSETLSRTWIPCLATYCVIGPVPVSFCSSVFSSVKRGIASSLHRVVVRMKERVRERVSEQRRAGSNCTVAISLPSDARGQTRRRIPHPPPHGVRPCLAEPRGLLVNVHFSPKCYFSFRTEVPTQIVVPTGSWFGFSNSPVTL